MRKRVFLKSPVQENRTPGSVRGLLGDWQSYRDGRAKPQNARSLEPWELENDNDEYILSCQDKRTLLGFEST
jgi:hypothetical protein